MAKKRAKKKAKKSSASLPAVKKIVAEAKKEIKKSEKELVKASKTSLNKTEKKALKSAKAQLKMADKNANKIKDAVTKKAPAPAAYPWERISPKKSSGSSQDVVDMIYEMSNKKTKPSLSNIRKWARERVVTRKLKSRGYKSKSTAKYRRMYEYNMPAIVDFVTKRCTRSERDRIYCKLKALQKRK